MRISIFLRKLLSALAANMSKDTLLPGFDRVNVWQSTLHLVLVDPVHWLSRPAPGAGLVALRKHLFVGAMVAWVHPGPATNRQIRRQRGSPRSEGVKFSGDPCPLQDLLLCAKHLFVAAMVAEVHPGLPESANQAMTAGRPRLEPVGHQQVGALCPLS